MGWLTWLRPTPLAGWFGLVGIVLATLVLLFVGPAWNVILDGLLTLLSFFGLVSLLAAVMSLVSFCWEEVREESPDVWLNRFSYHFIFSFILIFLGCCCWIFLFGGGFIFQPRQPKNNNVLQPGMARDPEIDRLFDR